jgi:hypothetical protein
MMTKKKIPAGPKRRKPKRAIVAKEAAGDGQERQRQKSILLSIAQAATLLHDANGNGYAVVRVKDHQETWAVDSAGFRRWLQYQYYSRTGDGPSGRALAEAMGTIAARAQFDGDETEVHCRFASRPLEILIDLGDADWRVVQVDAAGWRVAAQSPLRFRRSKGMRTLPVPEPGGSIYELRPFVNVASENDFILLVGWLLAAMRPGLPFLILALYGEQGSAKSTTCRHLRALIDPNEVSASCEPRSERDLVIAAANSWLLAFDNLSEISARMSDSLCRLATGAGFRVRQLYENREEELFALRRPCLINGIAELATRSDLLDRCIALTLPPLSAQKRKDEASLAREFRHRQGKILGALLSALSAALATVDTIGPLKTGRMADAERWVTAAEHGLPWRPGRFAAALRENRQQLHETALEASHLYRPLKRLLRNSPRWRGTASRLQHALLNHIDHMVDRGPHSWAKSAQAVSNELRRIEPNLRHLGIVVLRERAPNPARTRMITIERTPVQRVQRARIIRKVVRQ